MSLESTPATREQLIALAEALNKSIDNMLKHVDSDSFSPQQLEAIRAALEVNAQRMVEADWASSEAADPEAIAEQFRWNSAWVINILNISDTFADAMNDENGNRQDNTDEMVGLVIALLTNQINPIGAGYRTTPNWNGEES